MTGAYSEHAKTEQYTQRRGAWGDAHRAAGTHRANRTGRTRSRTALTLRKTARGVFVLGCLQLERPWLPHGVLLPKGYRPEQVLPNYMPEYAGVFGGSYTKPEQNIGA